MIESKPDRRTIYSIVNKARYKLAPDECILFKYANISFKLKREIAMQNFHQFNLYLSFAPPRFYATIIIHNLKQFNAIKLREAVCSLIVNDIQNG